MANLQIAPLKIVGYEGLFGTIAMVAIMLPVVQFLPGVDGTGIHEDTIETLHVSPPPPPFLPTHMSHLHPSFPSVITLPLKALLSQIPRSLLSPPLQNPSSRGITAYWAYPPQMQRTLLAAGPTESMVQIFGTLEKCLQRDSVMGTLGSKPL